MTYNLRVKLSQIKNFQIFKTFKLSNVMASIESRIDAFIEENQLDESIKESICSLVSSCFEATFRHLMSEPVPEIEKVKKETKVAKVEKIENPGDVSTRDELRKCTSVAMNQYCKENSLRVGGNKQEIMDRVWRHIQGEASDDDVGRSAKPKKEKKPVEKHVCFACNSKGAPCSIAATVEVDGEWFCFRHEEDSAQILAAKKPVVSEPEVLKKTKKKVVQEIEHETEISEPELLVKYKKNKKKIIQQELQSESD